MKKQCTKNDLQGQQVKTRVQNQTNLVMANEEHKVKKRTNKTNETKVQQMSERQGATQKDDYKLTPKQRNTRTKQTSS